MKPEKAKIISTLCLIDEYAIFVTDHMKKGGHNKFPNFFDFLKSELELFEEDQAEKQAMIIEDFANKMKEEDKFDLDTLVDGLLKDGE